MDTDHQHIYTNDNLYSYSVANITACVGNNHDGLGLGDFPDFHLSV